MIYYKTFIKAPEADWVVFLHGAGGSSSIWFKQLRDFRKTCNLLILDLRGHGKSSSENPKAIPTYSFRDVTTDVLEVMDRLQIPSGHFIGMSLGTIIIRNLAEIAPHRIRSMILGGAVTRFSFKSNLLFNLGNLIKRIIPYQWMYRLFAKIIMPRPNQKQSRLIFINEAKKICHNEFRRWLEIMACEMRPLLIKFSEKETDIPTLYLMGEQDYLFLPPVREMVSKHQASQLQVIPGAGHVCNVDQADTFNQLALDFIVKQSDASNGS